MIKNYLKINTAVRAIALIAFTGAGIASAQAPVTQTFLYTGSVQTFVVPACVGSMTIDVKAASGSVGGSSGPAGANGGAVRAVITATTGQTMFINVGGTGSITAGGFNGGGNGGVSSSSNGGGGGGASDVRIGSNALTSRLIVAGGGGGGGGATLYAPVAGIGGGGSAFSSGSGFGGAGAGGCAVGGSGGQTGGTAPTYGSGGGGGGFTSGGGGGGQPSSTTGGYGCPGALGLGGDGGGTSFICGGATGGVNGGGGGGGGFYGGGGGMTGTGGCNGGGGGGSSWANNALCSGIIYSPGSTVGNGTVTITYAFNGTGVSISTNTTTICNGSSTALNGSGVLTYTWLPVGGFAGSNNQNIVVSPTSGTTYTVLGTNSLGCVSSTVISIGVDPTVPVLSINTSSSTVCLNKPVTITASGATTYTYAGGLVTNGVAFIPSSTSGYTVTGQNACGTSTISTSVTVNPLPNITASVNNPTICNGSSVVLNGGGSVGGYTWTGGVTNNVSFTPPTTASYTVTGIAANGCTATAVSTVTVLVTPNIQPVATPTSICLGSTAVLSAIGATGYTWTPGPALNSSTITVSPQTTTTYTVVRSNGACTSTANVTLVINPLPTIVGTASPTQICVGEPVVLNVFGAISYTWLPGNFTASNFTLFPNSSTCYTVTGSNGSCTAVSAACVSVNPIPAITILTPTISICEGSAITFTATGAPSYTWLTAGTNTNNSTITVTPSVTSQYTVLGSNSFNCVIAQTQLVIVNALPSLSLTSNIPYACTGNAAILTVGATSPNSIYTWSGGITANGPVVTVNPTITTNYFATGTNTLNGCTTTNSISLAVYISTFVVSSPTAICKGNNGILSANGAANSYVWSDLMGNIATTSSVSVSPLNTTTYFVTGTTGSCTTTQTVPLIVNNLPNVTAESAKPQLCRLEFGTVTASGATSYVWAHGVTTAMFTFNTLTITTTYTVTGTDNNGCSKTTTVTQFIATCPGFNEIAGNNGIGLTVYPNPNNGYFIISSEAEITVNIINAIGQVMTSRDLKKDHKNEITLSSLPAGIYFITGERNGIKVNKKFVVE